MLKIQFTNARVEDHGFGLKVNGKELLDVISTALGTKVDNNYGYGSGLPSFKSNCCNVTIIIDPQPVTEEIQTTEDLWHSIEDMEERVREQYQKKARKAES